MNPHIRGMIGYFLVMMGSVVWAVQNNWVGLAILFGGAHFIAMIADEVGKSRVEIDRLQGELQKARFGGPE